jgi:potassium efflux system protein
MNLDEEPKRRASRRQEIPQQLLDARKAITEIRKQMELAPSAGEDPEVSQARKTLLQAQDQLTRCQMYANWRELRSYDASNQLLAVQRDLAARRQAYTQGCLKIAQDLLAHRRQEEAEALAKKAAELTQSKYASIPAFKTLAEENVALAQQRLGKDGVTTKLVGVMAETDRLSGLLDKLREARKNVTDRVAKAGSSSTIGELLRRQRGYIRELRQQADAIADCKAEISRVQLQSIDLEDLRTASADVEARTREWMEKLPPSQAKDRNLEAEARQLLQNRRDAINALWTDYDTYSSKLSELEMRQHAVKTAADEFSQYIDERVLWVRSAGTMGESDLTKAW